MIINIRFPFSDINDNDFVLLLSTELKNATSLIASIDADGMFEKTFSDEDVTNYTGTLSGSVVAEDDQRDDVLSPLICSKLNFNIVCHNYPKWLLDSCNYYTDVRVLLYAINSSNTRVERWRGYLQCQTLNMTTVEDYLSCPLTAIDEVGLMKYIKAKDVLSVNMNSSPYTLLKTWMAYNINLFSGIYTQESLDLNQKLHFADNRCIIDDNSNEDIYILEHLSINLPKYSDSKLDELFTDFLKFLGLKFAIGAIYAENCNDTYLVTDLNDGSNYSRITYDTSDDTSTISVSPAFGRFINPQKVDANFQITMEPDKVSRIDVKSEAQEPESHTYLDDKDYYKISPSTGHQAYALKQWGRNDKKDNTYREFKYHKLYLLNPTDKEGDFITLENCQNIQFLSDTPRLGAYLYWSKGVYPLPESRPDGTDTDNLDFIQSKRGIVPIKLGEFVERSVDEDNALKNYLLMCNNFWGSMIYYNDYDECVYEDPSDSTPFTMATLKPFKDEICVQPYENGYLFIDFKTLILMENISSNGTLVRPTNTMTAEDIASQMVEMYFPSESTFYDFKDTDLMYHGHIDPNNSGKPATECYPTLKMRISIGNMYWDGTSWQRVISGTPPYFEMPLIDGSSNTTFDGMGRMYIGNDTYFYNELHPANTWANPESTGRKDQSKGIYIPIRGLGDSSRPLNGQLKIDIVGPMPYQTLYYDVRNYNSVLFLLMSDFDIRYTNDLEIASEDMEKKYSTSIDASSLTKEPMEVNLELASAPGFGYFRNVMLYDGGSLVHNLTTMNIPGGSAYAPEQLLSFMYARIYNKPLSKVMFTKLWDGTSDTDFFNADFTFRDLTEIEGEYQVLTRTFDYVNGKARFELMRVDQSLD